MPKNLPRAALAALVIAIVANAQAAVVPFGFVEELVAGGYVKPIGLAFLPDGRLLVIEQESHNVFVRTSAGVQALVGTIPGVANGIIEDERGVQHMAVDPQWPTRPYIYVWYSAASPFTMWLSMFAITGDLTNPASTSLALGPQYIIFNDLPKVSENHNGGAIRFGTDGMLYLSTGEDLQFCPAQDLGNGLGKMLRLDVSTLPLAGTGPPLKTQIAAAGNPFTGPNDWSTLIWGYGLRNPFRFDIDKVSGAMMIADVGEMAVEEIDVCTASGQNFGWPWLEGNNASVGCGGTAPAGMIAPLQTHTHASAWYCVISLGFYRNPPGGVFNFGSAYEGDYFYCDYIGGFVRRRKYNGSAWVVAPAVTGQPGTDWAQNIKFVTDSTVGPDGAFYYLKRHPAGELRRIRSTFNPGTITAISGHNQALNAGTAALTPLTARFLAPGGAPVAGQPVTFAVTTGGGQVGPQPVLTDSQGYATTSFMPSVTDTTNPVVTASSLAASSAAFNLVWRGLTIDYQPAISTVNIVVKHSQAMAPFTLVFDAPPAPSALAWTPWGLVWTSVISPAPGMLALDGLALVGPPNPGIVTGSPDPTWVATIPGLPPLGGLTVLGQAYGIDTSRLPAPDAYFISNPVTVTFN